VMTLSGRRGSGLCLCGLCAEASGCRRPPVSVATRNRALAAVGDKHWLSTQSEGWMASMARSEVAERCRIGTPPSTLILAGRPSRSAVLARCLRSMTARGAHFEPELAAAAALRDELVDVLRDVSTDAVRVRRLGTYAYEPGSIEHLRRTHIVHGDASKERSRRVDGE
jgi:hypothetical protein